MCVEERTRAFPKWKEASRETETASEILFKGEHGLKEPIFILLRFIFFCNLKQSIVKKNFGGGYGAAYI